MVLGVSFSVCGAQTAKDEEAILEAIRSGKLKLTDEMIEAQKKVHPELNRLSNQEIRAKLKKKE